MAGLRNVFRDSLLISTELYRLVQDQLSEAPRTNTLNDLRTTMETLSNLTSACESLLTDISTQGKE
jgi:flagellin-specific chaperone FliS